LIFSESVKALSVWSRFLQTEFQCAGLAQISAKGGQMIRSQGKYFSKDEIYRIVMLLRESDMTLPEIAGRMRCSRSAVAAINRKFQVRFYDGKRSEWSLIAERSTGTAFQEFASSES
jgi:hypothetical protein